MCENSNGCRVVRYVEVANGSRASRRNYFSTAKTELNQLQSVPTTLMLMLMLSSNECNAENLWLFSIFGVRMHWVCLCFVHLCIVAPKSKRFVNFWFSSLCHGKHVYFWYSITNRVNRVISSMLGSLLSNLTVSTVVYSSQVSPQRRT